MIKRFLLIIGTVCMFSVLTAAPAFAATVRFVPPTPSGGQTVTGTQTIQVEATGNPGLLGIGAETPERITVTVRPRPGTGGSGKEYQTTGGSMRFSWDTKPLHNGGYDLSAVAIVNGSSVSAENPISNVMVNNPPARPSGVKGALLENSVSLTWNANNEPDLTGY
jgi:hypothetical protein